MASKNIEVKGVLIDAPTEAAAVALYRKTVGHALAKILDQSARDDVQLTVGVVTIKAHRK